MIKQILALLVCFAMLASATLIEKTLATAGTEESLSTLVTTSQLGNNTYAVFISTSASDNTAKNITLNYMTSGYALKSITYALNGATAVQTTATNYVYDIPNAATSLPIALTMNGSTTLKSNGKNASLTCANYTNVYYVSYTVANYTCNMNATSATATGNSDDGTTATINPADMTQVVFTSNTYPTALWYYYNPALNLTGYSNTSDLVLPTGEYFSDLVPFTATPESMNGTVTITQIDSRTYNLTTNATASTGWYVIPSNKLAQNKRVVADPTKLEKCVNATLELVNGQTVTTTAYSRTGSKKDAVTDIAYIYGASMSSAASGNVTVNNTVGTVLTILAGATAPVDNGGEKICLSSNQCTVNNLFYGGDATYKLTAKVFARAGTNTSALAVYQIAGMGNWGNGIIHFKPGERLVWYAKPYTSGTNITLNYEAS